MGDPRKSGNVSCEFRVVETEHKTEAWMNLIVDVNAPRLADTPLPLIKPKDVETTLATRDKSLKGS